MEGLAYLLEAGAVSSQCRLWGWWQSLQRLGLVFPGLPGPRPEAPQCRHKGAVVAGLAAQVEILDLGQPPSLPRTRARF